MAIGGIQMIADIVHLRLVNKHALVDGDDGAGLQLAFRADDLDVFRRMRLKPAVRVHKLAVFVSLPNMLHIIRDFFQAFFFAEHQDKAVFAHARIAFPTVVHVTIIPVIADDPEGIQIKLFVHAAAVFLRLLHYAVVPFRHVVDGVDDLLNMFGTETVFGEVGAIVLLFVARVSHNTESVFRAVVLNGLESDAHVLPAAVEVLVGKRQGISELVTFVLVVNLVVFILPRQREKAELKHSRTVLGLIHRRQGDAFQNGIVQVHIEGNRSTATEV